MRQLAAMGALSFAICIASLSPIPVHADVSQSVADTETTDPATYGGWSQSLGNGISGITTEIGLPIHWFSNYSFSADLMTLNLEEYFDSNYQTNASVQALVQTFRSANGATSTILFNSDTLGFPWSYTFNPDHYYRFVIHRTIGPSSNFGNLFTVFGSATDTYPGGNTDAGGLADLAFTIKGATKAAPSSGISNVLFLPGIEGSRLYRPDYNGGTDKLWEPDAISSDVPDMYSDPSGNPVRDDIYVKEGDIIDSIPGQGNVYGFLKQDLDTLKSEGKIGEWEAVAYDWRLPIDVLCG